MKPLDQATRDLVTHELQQAFSVQAGAGTGKTSLLTARYLELIRTQAAKPTEIVTITFTEKAAGELRDRIQDALEKDGKTDLLLDLDRAPISTIHALATSIIRERPIETGVDPNFEQLDEVSAQMYIQDLYGRWLAHALHQEGQPFLMATSAGIKTQQIRDLAFVLYHHRDLLDQLDLSCPPLDLDEAFSQMLTHGSNLEKLAEDSCTDLTDAGFTYIQSANKELQAAKELTVEGRIRAILLRLAPKRGKGNQKNWASKEACQRQKEVTNQLAELIEQTQNTLRRQLFLKLLDWLRGFVRFVQEDKAKQSRLDFDDLLLLALQLFRDHPSVLDNFRRKYKFVLVDEFQDTDPIQSELVWLLSGRPQERGEWKDLEIAEGRLFVVGDPQQSIYRFRKADINTYRSTVSQLTPAVIQQNFRSSPSLINAVNQLFSSIFSNDYQPLMPDPNRPQASASPPLIRLEPELTEGRYTTRQRRRQEAQAIAAFIQHTIHEPSLQVFDRKTETYRPYEYGDFAVLFPTMTDVDFFEEQLRHYQVPFSLEGGKSFYGRWEVHGLLTALYAIEYPTDRIAVVAALRSILFGFSDDDLLELMAIENSFDYRHLQLEKYPEAARFVFSLLRELHAQRREHKPSTLIRNLLTRTHAIPITLLRFHGEQAAANLQKMVALAQELELRHNLTLGEFIRWVEGRAKEAEKQGESPLSESGENTVRLMTIHKAKGLEFPCVILANLASKPQIRERVIADRLTHRLEIGIGEQKKRACTSGYEEALEREKEEIEKEKARLLYVGMTRACDLLVLPRFLPSRGDSFFWKLLDSAWSDELNAQTMTENDFSLVPPRGPQNLPTGDAHATHGPSSITSLQASWKNRRKSWVLGLPLTTPTEGKKAYTPAPHTAPQPLEATGTQLGSAFHQVMESFPWPSKEDLVATVQKVAFAYVLQDKEKDLLQLVQQATQHPILERVTSANQVWKELPFAWMKGEKLFEGVVDLVFQEDGDLIVLDYKTDKIALQELPQRANSYRPQMDTYAEALKALTGLRVKECVLFFARLGETFSFYP